MVFRTLLRCQACSHPPPPPSEGRGGLLRRPVALRYVYERDANGVRPSRVGGRRAKREERAILSAKPGGQGHDLAPFHLDDTLRGADPRSAWRDLGDQTTGRRDRGIMTMFGSRPAAKARTRDAARVAAGLGISRRAAASRRGDLLPTSEAARAHRHAQRVRMPALHQSRPGVSAAPPTHRCEATFTRAFARRRRRAASARSRLTCMPKSARSGTWHLQGSSESMTPSSDPPAGASADSVGRTDLPDRRR